MAHFPIATATTGGALANRRLHPAGGVPDGNSTSDYGTAFDPYVIQGSQGFYPYVIQGAAYRAEPAVTINSTSDYGTAFDPYVIQGSQPRSVSSFVPDEDYAAPAQAATRAQVWGGACRPGGGVCIPDEDYAAVPAFVPDQFTYREDRRASAQASVSSFLPGRTGRWIYA